MWEKQTYVVRLWHPPATYSSTDLAKSLFVGPSKDNGGARGNVRRHIGGQFDEHWMRVSQFEVETLCLADAGQQRVLDDGTIANADEPQSERVAL